MNLSYLNNHLGYITFTYPDGKSFYIKTSFNTDICKQVKDDCLYDFLSGKFINKRIFNLSAYKVSDKEPIHLSRESCFIKQFL